MLVWLNNFNSQNYTQNDPRLYDDTASMQDADQYEPVYDWTKRKWNKFVASAELINFCENTLKSRLEYFIGEKFRHQDALPVLMIIQNLFYSNNVFTNVNELSRFLDKIEPNT